MDNFVKEKLKEWNLSSLVDILEENMIDKEAFLLLDEETLREMISAVGPRIKLQKKLRELQESAISENQTNASFLDLSTTSNSSFEPAETSTPKKRPPTSSLETFESSKKTKCGFSHSVRSILEKNVQGKEILDELDRGILHRKKRIRMVQILVAYIIEHFGDRPSSEVKVKMACCVIDEFPFLKDDEGLGYEAWFTPGKGIHSATGWLEERLRNFRKRNKVRDPSVKRSTTTTTMYSKPGSSAKVLPESDTEESDHHGMKEWLKHHTEPASTVKNYMEKTVVNRAKWIRDNKDLPINAIMDEYPRLFDTPAMVEMDFRMLYPDVAENLFLRLTPIIVEKLISYGHLQDVKWALYLETKPGNLKSDEQKKNAALSLLPCNFPTGRNGKTRCSLDEAIKSFIHAKTIGTNIPKYLDEASRSPHILALGSRDSPDQCFVIVDGKAMEQPSLVKAIDVCFKLFYLLDIHYPWQCATTWEFIQKYFYGIDDNGRTSPSVISIRAALK